MKRPISTSRSATFRTVSTHASRDTRDLQAYCDEERRAKSDAGGRHLTFNELRFKPGRGAAADTKMFLKWLAFRVDQRA
jgi:hypothetical protein